MKSSSVLHRGASYGDGLSVRVVHDMPVSTIIVCRNPAAPLMINNRFSSDGNPDWCFYRNHPRGFQFGGEHFPGLDRMAAVATSCKEYLG